MSHLRVIDDLFQLFPDTVLGVVTVHGTDNSGGDGAVLAALRREEERVRERLAGFQLAEVRTRCGGSVRRALVDRDRPRAALGPDGR